MFQTYIDYHAIAHCKRVRDIERARQYVSHWEGVITGNISRFDIQELHSRLGAVNGTTTANRVNQLVSTIFNRAIDWEIYEGIIAAALNHKDLKSTAVYARLKIDTVRDAMERPTAKCSMPKKERTHNMDITGFLADNC